MNTKETEGLFVYNITVAMTTIANNNNNNNNNNDNYLTRDGCVIFSYRDIIKRERRRRT